MSRIAPPAEKIDAVGRIYRELKDALEFPAPTAPVIIALIDASVRIALATDTRDMGILGTDRGLVLMAGNPAATVPPARETGFIGCRQHPGQDVPGCHGCWMANHSEMGPSGPGYESGPGQP